MLKRFKVLEESVMNETLYVLYVRNFVDDSQTVLIFRVLLSLFLCISVIGVVTWITVFTIYSEEYDFVFPLSWKELKSFDNKQAAYNYAEEYLRKKEKKERRNTEYF